MRRVIFLPILGVFFLVYGIIFAVNRFANATTPTTPDAATIEAAKSELFGKLCSGHGGVNCSVLNADATVVCTDGTIDESFPTIYGVPQCQKIIADIAKAQSDFMAETGCFVPSELRCINDQSYKNLYTLLTKNKTVNTELGQGELAQCRKQIGEYVEDNKKYRQCLVNNNQPNFELSGKVVLPFLKTVFCPLVYGDRASYDQTTDLCLCAEGYFMSNEQCVDANKLCQAKYGANVKANNGNCVTVQQSSKPAVSLAPIKPSPSRTPVVIPSNNPAQITEKPEITVIRPDLEEYTPVIEEKPQTNFVKNVLSSIMSGFKKLLKLI